MRTLLSAIAILAFALTSSKEVACAGPLPISPGSWTLAILPDTQTYSFSQQYAPRFLAQTQFLKDHADDLNIKFVLHEGDLTENNTTGQWDISLAAMSELNGTLNYAMVTGNHDVGPNGNATTRDSLFNNPAYFGPGSFYATQPSVGGFYDANKTASSWHTFNDGQQDWLVLALEWGPSDQVVAWADQVLDAHPNHRAMILTHAYMFSDNTRYNWAQKGTSQYANPHQFPPSAASPPENIVNDGEELWNKLVRTHDNVDFVFSGHVLRPGVGYRSDLSDGGNPVHQMLANYQDDPNGVGMLRLLEFKTDGSVQVRTYSPFLDVYNQEFNQQFSLQVDQLRAPLVAPPQPTRAIAANLTVWGSTNPVANTVDLIAISQTSVPAFSTPTVNRGDYKLAVDGKTLKYTDGILLATISQNERPDFVGRRGTVEVSRNSFGDGALALALTEPGGACCSEVNFDTSVAWFRFGAGFRGAHVNADGNLAAGAFSGVAQANITRPQAGRFIVNLGVNSHTDGMLFTIGDNNSNVVTQTGPLANGSGWDVRVAQSNQEFGTSTDSTPAGAANWSFLYLPFSTPGLIGGYFDGTNSTPLNSVGNFTMNRLSTGQYELTVTGQTPETGMLIMTVANLKTIANVTSPDDNFLSYESSANGTFLINSYDLPSSAFEDTTFAWAFINFANGIVPFALPGDFNQDNRVDQGDYMVWQQQFGMTGQSLSADANGDGTVDTSDYVMWRNNLGAIGSGGSLSTGQSVPEPTTALLLSVTVAFLAMSPRRRATDF